MQDDWDIVLLGERADLLKPCELPGPDRPFGLLAKVEERRVKHERSVDRTDPNASSRPPQSIERAALRDQHLDTNVVAGFLSQNTGDVCRLAGVKTGAGRADR